MDVKTQFFKLKTKLFWCYFITFSLVCLRVAIFLKIYNTARIERSLLMCFRSSWTAAELCSSDQYPKLVVDCILLFVEFVCHSENTERRTKRQTQRKCWAVIKWNGVEWKQLGDQQASIKGSSLIAGVVLSAATVSEFADSDGIAGYTEWCSYIHTWVGGKQQSAHSHAGLSQKCLC